MMMDYSRRYRADGFQPARGRGGNLLCGFIQQQRCLSESWEGTTDEASRWRARLYTNRKTSGAHRKKKKRKENTKMGVDTLTLLFVLQSS